MVQMKRCQIFLDRSSAEFNLSSFGIINVLVILWVHTWQYQSDI